MHRFDSRLDRPSVLQVSSKHKIMLEYYKVQDQLVSQKIKSIEAEETLHEVSTQKSVENRPSNLLPLTYRGAVIEGDLDESLRSFNTTPMK